MKATIFSLIAIIGLILPSASAQQTMQFTFIGNAGGTHDSIIITSVEEFRMKDVEVEHMDYQTVDTLRTYILRNYGKRSSSGTPQKNTMTARLSAHTDIKVTGVDSTPLYFSMDEFSELISSAMRNFNYAGPTTPTLRFALRRLQFLGQERFFYRNIIMDSSARVDPRLQLKG